MQCANHIDGQAALAIEHFRDASPGPKDLFQVLACQPLLFHPKFDRLDRVRRIHRIVLGLVGFDESRKDVESALTGPVLGAFRAKPSSDKSSACEVAPGVFRSRGEHATRLLIRWPTGRICLDQ